MAAPVDIDGDYTETLARINGNKTGIGVFGQYASFFVSDKLIGSDSPLAEYGLVPLPDAEAKAVRDTVEKLTSMGAKS